MARKPRSSSWGSVKIHRDRVATREHAVLPESELKELRLACSRALSAYFERAHETCLFIVFHQNLPLSLEDRAQLLLHCRRENAARAEYEAARKQLIAALAGLASLSEI